MLRLFTRLDFQRTHISLILVFSIVKWYHLVNMKSIKPEEFFKKIAVNSGVSDLDTVRDIFYGMIRTMSRELRDKHIIRLPDWGDFKLKIHPARNSLDVSDRQIKRLSARPVIKFVPHHQVKKYFYALGRDKTVL